MNIEVQADQYQAEQKVIKLINLEEQYGVFDFTFRKNREFLNKTYDNREFDFDCCRAKVEYKDGYKVDFPIRTEEEYHDFLLDDNWQGKIKEFIVYPTVHFHEPKW